MKKHLQAVYKSQVFKVVESLEHAIDEAVILKAKSYDNTWEVREASMMFEDLQRWLRCWREYQELIRKDPDKMFNC